MPLLTAYLLQHGTVVVTEKKSATAGKKKGTFFPLKVCTNFILCFLYLYVNLFLKKSLKTSTDVDINFSKEKSKNCDWVKCSFYNHILILFLLHLPQKKVSFHWFYSKGKQRKSLFLLRGVKSWTRNLFPPRTFQMECCNFASLRQNEEYFHQVSHRASHCGHPNRPTFKNLCSNFFF